ncbi:hypothetical protein AB4865_02565 [Capnocytophaga sp. ARDL2]|uniref:hypothetical protein n=1 Tax=Capnocytophaga sp. ARDL2 TaxID=3238809 RepID=UPI00355666E6
MRKVYKIISLLLFSSVIFFSCDNENSEIERYKNGYRKPELIGKWKYLLNDDIEYNFFLVFNNSGEIYSERLYHTGEKNSFLLYYYYTKDNIVYKYAPGGFKKSGQKINCPFKIDNDTLKLFYTNEAEVYIRDSE